MFILTLALSFITPANACAMPRHEMVAVEPKAVDTKPADPKLAANVEAQKAEPKTLEQALADIDAAGIPELQNPPPQAAPQPPLASARID